MAAAENDEARESHDFAVKQFADLALVHLQQENVVEALAALEQGVAACESHPAFAKFAQSHCQIVEQLLSACIRVAAMRNRPDAAHAARGLLGRMDALNRTQLH